MRLNLSGLDFVKRDPALLDQRKSSQTKSSLLRHAARIAVLVICGGAASAAPATPASPAPGATAPGASTPATAAPAAAGKPSAAAALQNVPVLPSRAERNRALGRHAPAGHLHHLARHRRQGE